MGSRTGSLADLITHEGGNMKTIDTQTAQKLRGGYYTPKDIASFLVRWAVREGDRVLEPSVGDGVFLSAMSDLDDISVMSFEIDPDAAGAAAAQDVGSVYVRDFLDWHLDRFHHSRHIPFFFDSVVGNPPYIRYGYLPKWYKKNMGSIFSSQNCSYTNHTNAWAAFVVAAFTQLEWGGRMAMVLPPELIHVKYAASVRNYLVENARRVILIDPKEIWFEDTLQGSVLMLVEKKVDSSRPSEGVGIVRVEDREFLDWDIERVFNETKTVVDGIEDKWTRALLYRDERELLESGLPFGNLVKTATGVLTGAIKYFFVDDETVEKWGLHDWAYPAFGRSHHCQGVIYDENQHKMNSQYGFQSNLLVFHTETEHPYLDMGKVEGISGRYKCRIRKPWYRVPSVYSSPVAMVKRVHNFPRLIFNEKDAYVTNAVYRIKPLTHGMSAESMVCNSVNALTALSAEIEGRYYAGGVLEIIPSELRRLRFPIPGRRDIDIREMDMDMRRMSPEDMLEKYTRLVLGWLGGSNQDILLAAWKRLRDRRRRE